MTVLVEGEDAESVKVTSEGDRIVVLFADAGYRVKFRCVALVSQ